VPNFNRNEQKFFANNNWSNNRWNNTAMVAFRDCSRKMTRLTDGSFNRAQPAAQHAPNLMQLRFQFQILFIRYAFTIFSQPD
jgi:hypothetical protein